MSYKRVGEAPVSHEMQRVFDAPAISVQQTRRGWIQELCGCEAKSEYRVYKGHVEEGQPRDEGIPQLGHLLEDSPFLIRCCCAASRPFSMNFSVPDADGPTLLTFNKGWSNPIMCFVPLGADKDPLTLPCCCCLPNLETVSADGALLGATKYLCDMYLCVPKFGVYDATGTQKYLLRPDTCCGCCVKVNCAPWGGVGPPSRALYVPFLIRDLETGEPLASPDGGAAFVAKVWSGLKKECCTDADNFHVVFPAAADVPDRANLLGATVLIDFTWFEAQSTV